MAIALAVSVAGVLLALIFLRAGLSGIRGREMTAFWLRRAFVGEEAKKFGWWLVGLAVLLLLLCGAVLTLAALGEI